MSDLTKLTREDYLVFLDLTQDTTFTSNVWTRVKKSTQSTFTVNEVTNDYDYIDNKDTITENEGTQSSIALDQANLDGDPVYAFLEEQIAKFKIGEDAKVPFLYCFGGEDAYAIRGIASITDKELSPTDKTISYTLNIQDKETGTFTVSDGTPSFTPDTPSTALAVSPTSLTIVKGETGTVTVSGGTAPYTPTTTTANITASMGLDGVTCTVTTNNSSASSDTLTITDANDDTVTVAITVTEQEETQGEG